MGHAKLVSPHGFKERLLLYGGGGSGKSTAVCQIARHVPGTVWVIETDFSFSYERALGTEFQDVDNMTVVECAPDWTDVTTALAQVMDEADPDVDWVVLDSITPTWEYVQSHYSTLIHGEDLAAHMLKLRREATDIKEFNRLLLGDTTWPLIKKMYTAAVYTPIQKWRGHLVLTAEAKALGEHASSEEKLLYGHLGVKPAGEGRLHHVPSTTLFMTHPTLKRWDMSTVKDRNREGVLKSPVEDFALDYLVQVAGWRPARKPKPIEVAS